VRVTRNRLLPAVFAAVLTFIGAAKAEANCAKCNAGSCDSANGWESGNCSCHVTTRCIQETCWSVCRPQGVCDATQGCLSGGGDGPPEVRPGGDAGAKSSRCQSSGNRASIKAPIASVADPLVFDLLDAQFPLLAEIVHAIDLEEGPFSGNMGWRLAGEPDAKPVPGPVFSGSLARAKGGQVTLSVSLRPADGVEVDGIVEYELLMANDLLSGDVIEKRGDSEVRFSWTAEDVVRERQRRSSRAR
jgi:hypothetical protein